jgi:hypothetical protein
MLKFFRKTHQSLLVEDPSEHKRSGRAQDVKQQIEEELTNLN